MTIREHVQNGVHLYVPEGAEGVVREVFDEDCYRIREIPETSLVVDVGAHIGCFALRCAVERRCRVVAYEPNPETFGFLVASIRLNAAAVEPVFSAVGANDGLVPFFLNRGHPAGSTLHGREYPDVAYEEIRVPCCSLDTIVPSASSGTLVLKLDCEGAEREILSEHFAASLRRFDRVVGEWHNHDGDRYRDVLTGIGFDVELRGGGVPQPQWDPSIGGGLLYARRR